MSSVKEQELSKKVFYVGHSLLNENEKLDYDSLRKYESYNYFKAAESLKRKKVNIKIKNGKCSVGNEKFNMTNCLNVLTLHKERPNTLVFGVKHFSHMLSAWIYFEFISGKEMSEFIAHLDRYYSGNKCVTIEDYKKEHFQGSAVVAELEVFPVETLHSDEVYEDGHVEQVKAIENEPVEEENDGTKYFERTSLNSATNENGFEQSNGVENQEFYEAIVHQEDYAARKTSESESGRYVKKSRTSSSSSDDKKSQSETSNKDLTTFDPMEPLLIKKIETYVSIDEETGVAKADSQGNIYFYCAQYELSPEMKARRNIMECTNEPVNEHYNERVLYYQNDNVNNNDKADSESVTSAGVEISQHIHQLADDNEITSEHYEVQKTEPEIFVTPSSQKSSRSSSSSSSSSSRSSAHSKHSNDTMTRGREANYDIVESKRSNHSYAIPTGEMSF